MLKKTFKEDNELLKTESAIHKFFSEYGSLGVELPEVCNDITVPFKNNVDCIISISGEDTLILDIGLLHAGDILEIEKQSIDLIKRLHKPYYVIWNLSRMIDSNSLIHPEDFYYLESFSQFLGREGGSILFWIAPKDSILFCTTKKVFSNKHAHRFVDTLEEAKSIITLTRKGLLV